jgi:hypothetical protein
MLSEPILVLARPKYGVLTHYGVQFPDGTVYDYLPGENLRKTNVDCFAEGKDVTIIASIPWEHHFAVRARLRELERNPRKYEALNFNCEAFARWLTTGEAKSEQVKEWATLIGFSVLVALLASR